MPKVVDHEQRRQKLAEAVWHITANRGLDAVTLRAVASESNVSMGTVQHYFGTKDQMILFACQYMIDLANAGASDSLTESQEPDHPRTVIRTVMHQTLPLDEAQRIGSSVWLAFVARSAVDADLAALIRDAWAGLHELIEGQLHVAQAIHEVSSEFETDREAMTLVAVTDGLVSHLLVGHYSADEALAVVEDHLDRIFSAHPARCGVSGCAVQDH